MLSLWITATSYNDQLTGWDTPPMCKIRGDNAVYLLLNNKKQTGGLGVLLSIKMNNLKVMMRLVNL